MQPARKRYRDRAAERRGGIDENGHEASSMTYEESKFLGGDIERTHLVKGLDYLLLEKNRTKENDSGGGPENTAPENKANTELGQRVLLTACRFRQSLSDHDNSNVEPNDLFAPGRMYFEFDTSASCAITVHIRSQEEIAHYLEITSARASTTIPESDWLVLSKVIAAIAKPTMAVPDKAPTETSNQQRENIPVVVDNEDDIFEDAGV
ncbi:hypothetical protein IW140_006206 [Coemansia sp. RSA 1813]|nr:hypothetical protein EV178_006217 [Coemansia sp. RSA 1646]KAJ2210545.1 hypothetical protein EV179_006170 [Coemansia sp. RSA 487]KAJ2563187.1 hypothetical protein IW140_006206 [Coemansia sp. RSA 1813]